MQLILDNLMGNNVGTFEVKASGGCLSLLYIFYSYGVISPKSL